MKTFWRLTKLKSGALCLLPADRHTAKEIETWDLSKVRAGDLRCPRNPKFHRLAHLVGGMASQNLDAFQGMEGHSVLKRLQIESGIACDEMAIQIGNQMVIHRLPKSLSFASMGEDEFKDLMGGLCQYLCNRYWDGAGPEEVVGMAEEWERTQ